MTRTATVSIRCERTGCQEPATHIVSRIDAIRDWEYGCAVHAYERADYWPTTGPSELPPMSDTRPGPRMTLPFVLTLFPPRHRTVSRDDAKRLLTEFDRQA